MKVIIINGPNLNLLGIREKSIYGNISFEEYFEKLKIEFPNLNLEYFQSNIEGELIDKLQEIGFTYNAILLNAGGYTHTSIAISDCIKAIETPVYEIHISNIYSREEYRRKSLLSKNCKAVICGLGLNSYKTVLFNL
ncbi:MAG: 3-dehydroquinate dehydratase [Flavobacteriales bacterium]|nr:3-dehydroquinate dehydratase [Flavobacteriales bacterium]|tara:strand:+ start:422 stop:832 length:411 start_codon:yes stop_codon:yes gene_type:complete